MVTENPCRFFASLRMTVAAAQDDSERVQNDTAYEFFRALFRPAAAGPRDSLNNEFPDSFRARSANHLPGVPLPRTRVYGNGQTHHKPCGVGGDVKIEIDEAVDGCAEATRHRLD